MNEDIFHLKCLKCFQCEREIDTGEQLFRTDDNKYICKEDFESSKTKSTSGEAKLSTILKLNFKKQKTYRRIDVPG